MNGWENVIQTEEELTSLAGEPSALAKKKVVNVIDEEIRNFILKSPFLVLSTADSEGRCDVSPRGDAPGFVRVLSETQLLIPERPGNKRVDSLHNILKNPQAGLLFMIPSLGETLRINGRARIIKDTALLETLAVKGKTPLFAIGVDVEECFIHCAKAFKRSGLWDRQTWLQKEELPSAAKMLKLHTQLRNTSEEELAHRLEEGYAKKLY